MINISTGYSDISVDVIDYNMDLARHAWNCYRMTWKCLQNVEYNQHDTGIQEAIDNIIAFRALPMPREQALITFRINNISRVCLAQITRQRKAAFNVESQMPCPVTHNVILPRNIAVSDFNKRARRLIEESQALYDELIANGYPPQDARYLLMHGQTTSCVYVVDINTFIGSFGFRCENNLSDEINLVYRLCKRAILDKIADDYASDKIDALTYRMYKEIITPADAMGAKQHLGLNTDKVFGNSFRRYKDANQKVAEVTRTCDYDFKKSAWYLELIKLRLEQPDLLFDGEKEMIESWIK